MRALGLHAPRWRPAKSSAPSSAGAALETYRSHDGRCPGERELARLHGAVAVAAAKPHPCAESTLPGLPGRLRGKATASVRALLLRARAACNLQQHWWSLRIKRRVVARSAARGRCRGQRSKESGGPSLDRFPQQSSNEGDILPPRRIIRAIIRNVNKGLWCRSASFTDKRARRANQIVSGCPLPGMRVG